MPNLFISLDLMVLKIFTCLFYEKVDVAIVIVIFIFIAIALFQSGDCSVRQRSSDCGRSEVSAVPRSEDIEKISMN